MFPTENILLRNDFVHSASTPPKNWNKIMHSKTHSFGFLWKIFIRKAVRFQCFHFNSFFRFVRFMTFSGNTGPKRMKFVLFTFKNGRSDALVPFRRQDIFDRFYPFLWRFMGNPRPKRIQCTPLHLKIVWWTPCSLSKD